MKQKFNVLIAPDSFKGSITALEAAQAIQKGIMQAYGDDEELVLAKMLPMADGGEGFVDCIVTAGDGEIKKVQVLDPLLHEIEAFYGLIDGGKTAIIEVAAASGITLVEPARRKIRQMSTYGTGELIRVALDQGCEKVIIGLGGSGTNDGGVGMAQALGYRFYDALGQLIHPGSEEWLHIDHVDASDVDSRLSQVEVVAACDVDTLLYGNAGASAVFGPQKGANEEDVDVLDRSLRQLTAVLKRDLHIDVSSMKGGGAAGGLGAGITAFLNGKLFPGMDLILEYVKFDKLLAHTDLIFTGEGKTDEQSAMGKVPYGIGRRAMEKDIPVICLSGAITPDSTLLHEHGVTSLFSIAQGPASLDEAMDHTAEWLQRTSMELMRFYRSFSHRRGC